jgi:Carboxypeptidase regulatory-like domain
MRRLVLIAICGIVLTGLLGTAADAMALGAIDGAVSPLSAAQEVEVCVVLEGKPSEVCATPGPIGAYVLVVPEGLESVKLAFIPTYRSRLLTQFYDHAENLSEATSIGAPDEGAVTGIDADLVEGGAITGTVITADEGSPLEEVEVCAVSLDSPTIKSCDDTDASGEYELHSLLTGSYQVTFNGEGKSGGYESWSHPTVSVTAGYTAAGIDATLEEGGRIAGVVTAAAGGNPLSDVPVCLFGGAEAMPLSCTFSGESGEYLFEGLPSGSYQVGFSLGATEGGIKGGGFEAQYYDGVASRSAAATISLLAPMVVEGVDAALHAPMSPSASPSTATVPVAGVPAAATQPRAKPEVKVCKKPKHKERLRGKIRCVRTVKHRTHRQGSSKRAGHERERQKLLTEIPLEDSSAAFQGRVR